MAAISIKPSKARGVLDLENALQRTLQSYAEDVGRVRDGLRYKVSSRERISAALKEASRQLQIQSASSRALMEGLESVVTLYETSERNCRDVLSGKSPGFDAGGTFSSEGGPGGPRGGKLWDSPMNLTQEQLEYVWEQLLGDGPLSPLIPLLAFTSPHYFENKFEEKSTFGADLEDLWDYFRKKNGKSGDDDSWFSKWKKDLGGGKYVWDPETGEMVKLDPNNKAAIEDFDEKNKKYPGIPVDVKLASVGVSQKQAWRHYGNEEDAKNFQWGVSLLEAEEHADAYVGLGMVGAGVGVGATVFTAQEKAYLGTEDMNVYEKLKFDAGKVDANAEITAGFFNKDGEFDPRLYAGAKIEALAAEVTGEVGFDTPYGDIGLEGAVNFGIGAHANVGFVDGKFLFDVGAAVGLGFSVKAELDLSETVSAVNDFIDDAADFASDVGDAISDFASDVGDAVSDFASDVGDYVTDKAKDIFSGVKNLWPW